VLQDGKPVPGATQRVDMPDPQGLAVAQLTERVAQLEAKLVELGAAPPALPAPLSAPDLAYHDDVSAAL
jgi:hypothetical protein